MNRIIYTAAHIALRYGPLTIEADQNESIAVMLMIIRMLSIVQKCLSVRKK